MFAKVLELIAAIKAGSWKTVLKIALQILTDAVDSLPETPPQVGAVGAAGTAAGKSMEQICDELQACCSTQKVAAGENVEAGGQFIAIILPLILEVIRRYLPPLK